MTGNVDNRDRRGSGRVVAGRWSPRDAALGAALVFLVTGAPAAGDAADAAELSLTISGVRDTGGEVRVALCPEDQFLAEDDCPYVASAPATPGETEIVVSDVEPGVYGIQAYHDANANGELDRNLVGWPQEGFAFGNDAPIFMRPPSFEDASVEIGEEGLSTTISMRYR